MPLHHIPQHGYLPCIHICTVQQAMAKLASIKKCPCGLNYILLPLKQKSFERLLSFVAKRVLKDNLDLNLFIRLHKASYFIQNGTPCRKAKVVTAWFTAKLLI
jgi:hypothetical protein